MATKKPSARARAAAAKRTAKLDREGAKMRKGKQMVRAHMGSRAVRRDASTKLSRTKKR